MLWNIGRLSLSSLEMDSFLRGNSPAGDQRFEYICRIFQPLGSQRRAKSLPSLLKIPMKSYESTVRDEAKRKVCVEFLQISGIVTPQMLLISASKRVYQIVLYALSLFERSKLW